MSEINNTADGVYFRTVDDKQQGFRILGVVHHIGKGLIYDPKQPIINKETGEFSYNHFQEECVYFLEYDTNTGEEFISYYAPTVLLSRLKQMIADKKITTFEESGYHATRLCCVLTERKKNHAGTREYTDWRIHLAKPTK